MIKPNNDWLIYVIAIFSVLFFFESMIELYRWNHGICRKNHIPWIFIENDFTAGRYYQAGEEGIWVSWGYIDAAYRRSHRQTPAHQKEKLSNK